jgi:predicted ATPase
MIKRLQDEHKDTYEEWLAHVQTVLSDLKAIRVVEREDDRSVYLMLGYTTGVEIPSWMASDGTLRFLVITLIAYLPYAGQLYLLEEPENGVHPLAVDAIYDSLSSAYDSQVLVATHSPTFLKLSSPDDVLCVAKDDGGATDVISGNEHPILREWQGSVDMDALFATGVIG